VQLASNAWAFNNDDGLVSKFADGTSNTIALAEHYSTCNGRQFYWPMGIDAASPRRPTFADGGPIPNYPTYKDVYPVPSGRPPTTVGSVRGKTFQVAPSPGDCDPTVAQTPHPGGMLVALADGGVRTIAPNISESIYWAAVTPAGGESFGGW